MNNTLLILCLLVIPVTLDVVRAEPVAAPRPTKPADARLVPVMKDGVFVGLKVYAIQPGGRFARARFLAGDTIETVDALAVTTDEGTRRLHASMIAGTADATIVVRRGDQQVTLAARP